MLKQTSLKALSVLLLSMACSAALASDQHFHETIYNKLNGALTVRMADHINVGSPNSFNVTIAKGGEKTINYTVSRNCILSSGECADWLRFYTNGKNIAYIQTFYGTMVHGWFEYYHHEHTASINISKGYTEQHNDSGENWSTTIGQANS